MLQSFSRLIIFSVICFATSAWATEEVVSSSETEESSAPAISAGSTTITRTEPEDEDSEVVSETEIDRTTVEEAGEAGEPGEADGGVAQERTVIREKEVKRGGLDDQVVGITPQAGILSLNDNAGDGNVRAVGGITIDGNLFAGLPTRQVKPFLGPQVGVFYSHIGQPGANFFGLDSPGGDQGADLVLFPLNLKAGITVGESIRMAVHGGVNINYQHFARRDQDGEGTEFRNQDWDANTNLGGDLEFGLGKDVSLLLRPDWTFRPGADVFSATLGIGFPIS